MEEGRGREGETDGQRDRQTQSVCFCTEINTYPTGSLSLGGLIDTLCSNGD